MECTDGAVLHAWCLQGHGLAWRSWWEVGHEIASGRLVRGQRLPTHRALATALGIDLTTVTRAYGEARRRGRISGADALAVIDVHPGSRHYGTVVHTVPMTEKGDDFAKAYGGWEASSQTDCSAESSSDVNCR